MTRPVLLIGGMDSSGGAGLLRDTVTACGLGVPVRAVVTAITAQSDRRVSAVQPVGADMVAAQMRAACETPVGAVKIGMLACAAVVEAVAATLPPVPMVLDPVLAATSGRMLIDAAGLDQMLCRLLPHTTVLTPNLMEMERLGAVLGLADETALVAALLARGCQAVLVKGGHGETAESTDRLHLPGGRVEVFSAPRQPFDLRGTGCQLATAIAAHLAAGTEIAASVRRARASVAARFAAHRAMELRRPETEDAAIEQGPVCPGS